ncbi:glucuronoyl esterase, partial [Cristinia sonorae]
CPTPSTVKFNDEKLPNPFQFNSGAPVRTVADWSCRRRQIASLIQGFEAGELPSKPPHVSATFTKTGNNAVLNITAGTNTKRISFAPTITFPNTTAPKGGWPLVIGYGGGSIPVPDGVAHLSYDNSAMAQQNDQSSRGVGLFFDLYGNITSSSMTAWVWGVSRIIDALEVTHAANVNTKKIAVTGCSRNGKGALMAGAFEERIALTIPQESGSGGDTCWRLSKFEQDSGSVVQEAVEIVQENVWFSTNFDNFVHNISVLPYDHHLLAALVAPRPMISYENTDFVWLSPLSGFGCMTAAHTVWEALGAEDKHGFVQIGGHAHCAFPSNLTAGLNAFFDKFLLDKEADTNIFSTNGVFNGLTWKPQDWITWKTPKLRLL